MRGQSQRPEPCNLPRSVLTQWVKAFGCEIPIEIRKMQARMSGQLRFLAACRTFSVRSVGWLDGCKARRAANGCSIGKGRNAADAVQTRDPDGRTAF